MENKKLQKVSVAALIISVLPLATFIPVLLKITLSEVVRGIWTGANIVFVLVGLCLSIVCARNRENRSIVNIASTIISNFWLLIMAGIVVLALFLNFLQ
jgi:D-alanyl-lipoteichoic acid acyltransferase DltB (MBOAT superfamily)